MTDDRRLDLLRDAIQSDPGGRGLARDPAVNLVSFCRNDFRQACRSLAQELRPSLGIVTGFCISRANPPSAETDGPLGALFLARALVPLGVRVTILTDSYAFRAMVVGLESCGLQLQVPVVRLPEPDQPGNDFLRSDWPALRQGLTHLIALERVGPSYSLESIGRQAGTTDDDLAHFRHEVPPTEYDRCHNMRGDDITSLTAPAHLLFENAAGLTTIGIGDGGNEIGMGRIPWDVIRRNIPRGYRIACRVSTDFLIVAGVSNWGAYALAAGFMLARGQRPEPSLFDPDAERRLLELMVDAGPLVDGPTAQRTATVDGLDWETYAEPLRHIGILFGD